MSCGPIVHGRPAHRLQCFSSCPEQERCWRPVSICITTSAWVRSFNTSTNVQPIAFIRRSRGPSAKQKSILANIGKLPLILGMVILVFLFHLICINYMQFIYCLPAACRRLVGSPPLVLEKNLNASLRSVFVSTNLPCAFLHNRYGTFDTSAQSTSASASLKFKSKSLPTHWGIILIEARKQKRIHQQVGQWEKYVENNSSGYW